jgi:multicomponent Na+:H+ antiporter subunit D
MDALPVLAITVPVLAAVGLIGFGARVPRVLADALATGTAALVLLGLLVLAAGDGPPVRVSWLGGWLPDSGGGVGIALVADRFAAGLAALAAGLVTVALLYSWRYLESDESHFHALVLLFLAGMIGFTLSGDLFDMLVFFELMGAAAYGLAGYKVEEPRSVQGGLTFGVVNSVGAYVTLAGIALLYARTGQLGLAQLAVAVGGQPGDALLLFGFALVVCGWLVKSAVAPFHFWLADAHAVAPTPICMVFSGVMAELGLYATLRFYTVVFEPVLPEAAMQRACTVLGVATAVVGALMCLRQRHLKRLLAFSTIAHIGLFLLTLRALDPAALGSAALYVVGHAGVKGALFGLVGLLLARYGSVDELDLHGRASGNRVAGCLFLLGGLALAGMPPFGTGLGKAVGEVSAEHSGLSWAPWLFVAVSAATGAAVLRAGARVYFGAGPAPADSADSSGSSGEPRTSGADEERETEGRLPRAPRAMYTAVLTLLAVGLAVGVLPGVGSSVAVAAADFGDRAGYLHAALGGPPSPAPPDSLGSLGWTASGAWLGLFSAALASAAALGTVYRRPLVRLVAARWPVASWPRAARPRGSWVRAAAAPLRVLEALHSGHVGDYVAWLMVGLAVLGALVVLPT